MLLAYQRQAWLLFKDWCQATGERALPATPDALAQFLTDLPALRSVLLRRVRSVDAMHAAAGYDPPGQGPAVQALVALPPPPPRHNPAQVAYALVSSVIGNWPVGLVGRRDAALVALTCVAGFSRREARSLRVGPHLAASVPALLDRLGRTEAPGACPGCALSRWLRCHAFMASRGWRDLRDELADLGEVRAGQTGHHDCEVPIAWPERLDNGPLFTAIGYRGNLELRAALTERAISAIVGARLAGREEPARGDWAPPAAAAPTRSGEARDETWRDSLKRLEELGGVVEEAEAMAEAVLARLDFGR